MAKYSKGAKKAAKAPKKKTAVKRSAPKKTAKKKIATKKKASRKVAPRKSSTARKSATTKKAAPKKKTARKTAPVKKAAPKKRTSSRQPKPEATELRSATAEMEQPLATNHTQTGLLMGEDPVRAVDQKAFDKFTAKGDPRQRLGLSSKPKNAIKPSGKKPLW